MELEEKEREIQNMDSLRRAAKDSKSRTSSVKPGKRSVKKNIKILDPLTDVAASEEKAEVNVTEQTDENFDALPVQLPDCAFMERPNTGHAHSRGASRENKNSGLEVNWVSKDGEFGDFSYEATNSSRPSSGRVQLPPLYADDETGDCNTDPSRWEG